MSHTTPNLDRYECDNFLGLHINKKTVSPAIYKLTVTNRI